MANEGLQIKATAVVKLTKLDECGNIIGVEKRTVELTTEEAEALWLSQQQE
jgi:hypothetical protein